MQPQALKPLTALRFFAAMWVVLFDYWPKLAGVAGTPGVIAKGYLGVEVFFILSGFILCHVYLPHVEEGRYRHGPFLWARVARIYPMHLATLIAIAAMAVAAAIAGMAVDPDVVGWQALLANLSLTHAWGLAPSSAWNHSSWSISAEWFAYLCFPAFAWLAVKMRDRPWLAVAGALAVGAALYVAFQALAGFPLTQATFRWGGLRIVPCFLYGCALYLLWRSGAVHGRILGSLGALISGAGLLIGAQLSLPDAALAAIGGVLIFSLAVLSNEDIGKKTPRALVYLGEISYSIYMVVVPWDLLFVNGASMALHLPDKRLPLGLWLIFACAVIPLAAGAYHLIEKPARERVRDWGVGRPKRDWKSTPA